MTEKEKSSRQVFLGMVTVSGIASLSAVAFAVADGAGSYSGYADFLGRPLVILLFLAMLPASFLYAIFSKRAKASRFVPATLQALALLLIFPLNISKYVEEWNFNSRMPQRLEIIKMIEEGIIRPDLPAPCRGCFYANLPKGYKNVSAGGEIRFGRDGDSVWVVFFVARWGLFPDDDYTAFVYRSDDKQPQTEVEDTSRFTHIEQLIPHWFYVRHT